MAISKALVIADPWISLILSAEKIWEMRSKETSFRGTFGLIQKGSGCVVGVAELSDVTGPYSSSQLLENFDKHKVPHHLIDQPEYKWWYAWHIRNVKCLNTPVKYNHKSGAVTWVILDNYVSDKIQAQTGSVRTTPNLSTTYNKVIGVAQDDSDPSLGPVVFASVPSNKLVPKAKDGTRFTQEKCSKNGVYTVGSKGSEKKFRNYIDALGFLSTMPVAKWRRPNSNGNWGIVSAVEWIESLN